jgi:hypothetical protein
MPLPTDLKPVVNKLSRGRFATEVEFRTAALHYCASNLANNNPSKTQKPNEKSLAKLKVNSRFEMPATATNSTKQLMACYSTCLLDAERRMTLVTAT